MADGRNRLRRDLHAALYRRMEVQGAYPILVLPYFGRGVAPRTLVSGLVEGTPCVYVEGTTAASRRTAAAAASFFRGLAATWVVMPSVSAVSPLSRRIVATTGAGILAYRYRGGKLLVWEMAAAATTISERWYADRLAAAKDAHCVAGQSMLRAYAALFARRLLAAPFMSVDAIASGMPRARDVDADQLRMLARHTCPAAYYAALRARRRLRQEAACQG